MGSRTDQPNWDPAIVRFTKFVERNCVLEVLDPENEHTPGSSTTRPFLPQDKIQTYFKYSNYVELRAIICALRISNLYPTDIVPRYAAVFCTLLYAGKGQYIKEFIHHASLSDKALPFHLQSPPHNLPITPGDDHFLSDFAKQQWRFCAPELVQTGSDENFESERILPIIFKQKLRGGQEGSAKLWLVQIHPSYNGLITSEEKASLGEYANTFVIKEYSTFNAQRDYDHETSAFKKIGAHKDIIGYYGSFTRGDTFNVILEYADKGTLQEYFDRQLPPSTGDNIIRFWQALFQLIGALWKIHTVGDDDTQGWHQDVKPENILVFSNGSSDPTNWTFKLADLGNCHFKRKTSQTLEGTASDSYGTSIYGAPETSRLDYVSAMTKIRVDQNVDIWSLGCIYSETLRWLADGKLGIAAYQQERREEIQELLGIELVDYFFHNGYIALEAVRRSNRKAVKKIQQENKATTITGEVMSMVADMLVEVKYRPTAELLWRKQLRIVEAARSELDESTVVASSESGSGMAASDRSASRASTLPAMGISSLLPRSEPKLPHMLPPGYSVSYGASGRTIIHRPSPSILPEEHRHFQEPEELSRMDGNHPIRHSPIPILIAMSALDISGQRDSLLTPAFSSKAPNVPRSVVEQTTSNTLNQSGGYPHSNVVLAKVAHGSSRTHQNQGSYQDTRITPRLDTGQSSTASPGHQNLSPTQRESSMNHIELPNNANMYSSETKGPHDLLSVDFKHQDIPHSARNPDQTETNSHNKQAYLAVPISSSKPLSEQKDINDVLKWKASCKKADKYTPYPGLTPYHHERLEDRDHVFLIDDSWSMVEHWPAVVKVSTGLAYILKQADKDGLDLHFMISKKKAEKEEKTTKLTKLVSDQKQPSPEMKSDINHRLTKLLNNYREKLNGKKWYYKKPKPLSLYILTDGVWEYECTPESAIMNVVKTLSHLRKDKEQIGIQFISFGNDAVGLERLRALDDDLKTKLKLDHDIVDTTHWDGDVTKMLLGHINASMDGQSSRRPSSTVQR